MNNLVNGLPNVEFSFYGKESCCFIWKIFAGTICGEVALCYVGTLHSALELLRIPKKSC
jgi:hypothetical protein